MRKQPNNRRATKIPVDKERLPILTRIKKPEQFPGETPCVCSTNEYLHCLDEHCDFDLNRGICEHDGCPCPEFRIKTNG